MVSRRALVAAGIAAVALGSSGCSFSAEVTSGKKGGSASSSSGQNTRGPKAETFPFAKGEVRTSEFVDRVLAAQKDLTSYTLHMTTENPDGSMTVTSEYEKRGGVDRSHSIIKSGETTVEQIFIGDQGYDRKDDGTWEKAEGVTIGSGYDESLQQFAKNVKSVEYVGKDEHGHKFVVDVDMSEALKEPGKTMSADMWLDPQMRMVRVEYVFDNGNGQASSVTTRDGFDEAYNIEAPI